MQISIWEQESFYAPADVLIVGAGLLGLWTARELKILSPNLKVKLIDAGGIPMGASTRNAGFACFGSPSELLHDAALDEAATWNTVGMRYKGIEKIKAVFSEASIGYERCGGYEPYMKNAETGTVSDDQMAELNRHLKAITGQNTTFSDAGHKMHSLGLDGFGKAIENKLEAGLHSGKLVQALLQEVSRLGVTVVFGAKASAIYKANQQWQVDIGNGANILAEQVVVTTNGFMGQLLPDLQVVPARGQIIVTPPIPGLSLYGTFHFDEGFYYWRHLDNRVLLGGARNTAFETEASTQMETTDQIKTILFGFLQRHLPQTRHLNLQQCNSWAGIMAMSGTRQPVLKQAGPGIWGATCCNGMGVSLAPIWAEKIAGAVLGKF